MDYQFFKVAIHRHLDETWLLISQLTDEHIHQELVTTGRTLGEIILHMIRSLEFYSQGLAKDIWKPLSYSINHYDTAQKIKDLYLDVKEKVSTYLSEIKPESLFEDFNDGNRAATKAEVLMELLEHSIQHRGQILVYYRLIGIEPAKIPYII